MQLWWKRYTRNWRDNANKSLNKKVAGIKFVSKEKSVMPKVIIGVPINKKSAYILDKFLKNQQEIKREYQNSKIIFATEEKEFKKELYRKIRKYDLEAEILTFDVIKPDYAKDRIFNITQARETIRRYFLDNTDAEYLLFIDCDMIFEPGIIRKLLNEISNYDVVYNCYLFRDRKGLSLNGFGSTLIRRWVLEKTKFRCFEKKGSPVVVGEGVYFEVDLFKLGAKVARGIYVRSIHFNNDEEARRFGCRYVVTEPRPLRLIEKINVMALIRQFLSLFSESPVLMWIVTRLGVLLRDISSNLHPQQKIRGEKL